MLDHCVQGFRLQWRAVGQWLRVCRVTSGFCTKESHPYTEKVVRAHRQLARRVSLRVHFQSQGFDHRQRAGSVVCVESAARVNRCQRRTVLFPSVRTSVLTTTSKRSLVMASSPLVVDSSAHRIVESKLGHGGFCVRTGCHDELVRSFVFRTRRCQTDLWTLRVQTH